MILRKELIKYLNFKSDLVKNETKIAKVIVDVPTRQTDRFFDYFIPPELEVQPGMRVIVEFGQRQVTGFIVNIVTKTDFQGKLKPIKKLIDENPVLNEEQLKLAIFLAGKYFTFVVSDLWLMLPTMLKGKTTKFLVAKKKLTDTNLVSLLSNGPVKYETSRFSSEQLKAIKIAIAQGQVEIIYAQSRKITKKYEEIIDFDLTPSQITNEIAHLSKNNKYERLFWEKVSKLQSPLRLSHITKKYQIPRRVLNKLVEKKLITIKKVEKYRDPLSEQNKEKSVKFEHTLEQKKAIFEVSRQLNQSQVFLIEGITGSGKTEIYRALSKKVIDQGQQVIILVPEIALTPQMISFFQQSFGNRIAVWHSRLSRGEQYDEWRKIKNNEIDLVLGVRSAIFAPLKKLGLVIVDEEHESSYRQIENPQYDARDVAQWRGKYHQCPVIFGSATPTLTTRAKAQKGQYQLIKLTHRVNENGHLPQVQIIDLRDVTNHSAGLIFSNPLKDAILNCYQKHEQAILFLNRRGYANFMECRNCGYTFNCPNCDVSLTLHLKQHQLICHYCGYKQTIPVFCPQCHQKDIRSFGEGTEKVELALKELNPEIRTLRMDKDTTRRKGSYQKIIKSFEQHCADVLVGTQSVAKGLNFPEVTLVGVLNADISLNRPEFDSSEVTFDLLTQVAGRAGRGKVAGQVIIQTYNPNHYAIQDAKNQNYEWFFRQEMYIRHLHGYLPYFYTIFIKVTSKKEMLALKLAIQIKDFLQQEKNQITQILGPAPYYIKRINNEYSYQLALKYKNDPSMLKALRKVMQLTQKKASQVKIQISHLTR